MKEPLGYYCQQTSSLTNSNACLWLGTKNKRPASIAQHSWSSCTKECTCKLDCSLYAREKLSPVPVWLVQENFLEKIFQWKWAPKFTLPVSFDPLVSRRGEKFNNKFTNFKGWKNFFYMYLTSIPGRHKQSRRRFVRTILEDSAIYEFTFNRSTSWFFQLVHFSFCFVLLRC